MAVDYEFGGSWIPDGFQVKKIRRPSKDTPSWVNSDHELRARIFADPIRRYRIAYLYWRCGWSAQEVADELDMTLTAVKRVLYHLRDT